MSRDPISSPKARPPTPRESIDRRIRLAGIPDLSDLVDLVAATLTHPWNPEALESELHQPDGRIWMTAGLGDVLVGFLIARTVIDELHVLQVGVRPARRRRGLARELLEHALSWGRARGAPVAQLELRGDNEAALELYRSCGFVVVGRRPRYYPDRQDAILMTRPDEEDTRESEASP